MALATLETLKAIRAIRADYIPSSDEAVVAQGLLDLASSLVCVYFGVTEADVLEWTTEEQDAVAVTVAECAAQRIIYPASPTGAQASAEMGYPVRLRLTKAMKDDLRAIKRGNKRGTRSMPVTLGDDSTMSWERTLGEQW